MALPVFPNIQQPAYPLAEKLENPAIMSQMENGMVVSRPRFTRIRETFTLRWTALPAADYTLLRSFWKTTVLGGSEEFTWTYPTVEGDEYSGKVFTVRFASGDIHFDLASCGLYSGEVTFQEA